jgi:hypothetical protein
MLKQRRTDDQHPKYVGGATVRREQFERIVRERGGVTPHNLLVVPTGTPIDHHGHPAVTTYRLAEWWCRYLLPVGGVLIDPFCGSGTNLVAALNCGASRVIGIDKEKPYLNMARGRLLGEAGKRKSTLRASYLPTAVESSRRSGRGQEQVWPTAPDPFALDRVEKWKGRKLTTTEESLRRFFADKSWLVGGPIPLRLVYGAESISILDTHQHDGLRQAGGLLGRDAVKQLTEQMRTRDIDKKLHGGLALLYVRLCWRRAFSSEQAGLAS